MVGYKYFVLIILRLIVYLLLFVNQFWPSLPPFPPPPPKKNITIYFYIYWQWLWKYGIENLILIYKGNYFLYINIFGKRKKQWICKVSNCPLYSTQAGASECTDLATSWPSTWTTLKYRSMDFGERSYTFGSCQQHDHH